MDAVDLKKVAQHDSEEVAKVADVTEALSELESGHRISHVDGVDAVTPGIDERHEALEAIYARLSEAGWSERIGRILHAAGGVETLKPLDLCPHREGLPEFSVCLAPEACVGKRQLWPLRIGIGTVRGFHQRSGYPPSLAHFPQPAL